jgi:hypothetical protein
MEIFCFLCCGGHLGLVRRQEFSLPPTQVFNLAITRCADKPSGCAESSCPKHSAHPLGLSAHLEMRVVDIGVCLTSWVLSPTITSSRTSITRCPSVASLYRVDAPKAPVLSIRCIHLACRRISKCENYWLFCVVVELGVCLTSRVLPATIAGPQTKSRHNSMPWRRIIMPSGCAESACPKD